MQRSLRSNSAAPAIFPIRNRETTMADGVAAGGAAALVPPPPARNEVWTENPLTGNFNPGSTSGQKIFLEKTKGLEASKRLALTNSNSTEIMAFLKVKEQIMGATVTGIPTSYAGGIGIALMNLIHQSPSISLEMCQRRAHVRYGNPIGDTDPIPPQPWRSRTLDPANVAADKATFYDRVNANVVVEIVKNTLTPGGWDDLMLQEDKFLFISAEGVKSFDGPSLLKVVLEEIDPTSSVNIEMHRQSIEGAKLHVYKGNVVEMLKAIEKHYQAIVENGHAYDADTYRRHLMTALQTGSNAVFNTKLQTIKSDVDACYGYNANITPQALIQSAKQQYINISRRGEWNKIDPRDAQIMALTTALKDSKTAAPSPAPASGKNDPAKNDAAKKERELYFEWRTNNKGSTATWKGRLHTWCPNHKKAGVFDGMYYDSHTPETHDTWQAQMDVKYGAKKNGKRNAPATGTAPAEKSLKISDALKNALCTNLCVSEEDLAKIVESAGQDF